MAHLKKFTTSTVGVFSMHLERKTNNHSNKEIDIHKSHLNYSFLEGDMIENFNKRIKEVKTFNRGDVKNLCSWVITLPKEYSCKSIEEQNLFFSVCNDFLSTRYGSENCVCSVVHHDETTPHLHYAFIPVCIDKKGIEKVSAKAVITRNELQKFHTDLDNYLHENLEYYFGGVLNGATRGVETVEDLKRNLDAQHQAVVENFTKELDAVNKKLDAVNKELDATLNASNFQEKRLTAFREMNNKCNNHYVALRNLVLKMEKVYDAITPLVKNHFKSITTWVYNFFDDTETKTLCYDFLNEMKSGTKLEENLIKIEESLGIFIENDVDEDEKEMC